MGKLIRSWFVLCAVLFIPAGCMMDPCSEPDDDTSGEDDTAGKTTPPRETTTRPAASTARHIPARAARPG